jgi:hypothetical protein
LVIGAGPAGISTAYTLARQFASRKDVKLNIMVFEQNTQIGGRMIPSIDHEKFSIPIHAEDIAGGCLAHNRILRKRAQKHLGINYGLDADSESVVKGRKDGVGFWDGESMKAEMVRPRSDIGWGQWMKLVWKFGASFWRAGDLPTGTMGGWARLTNLRTTKKGHVFENMELWTSEASMSNAVSLSAVERLVKNGVDGDYVRDVLRAQVRRQTGGKVEELSDLALSMALYREDGGLCVEGNGGRMVDVLERFLAESKAEMRLGTKVIGLKRDIVQEGKEAWFMKYKGPHSDETSYEAFDKAIIAAPWNTSTLLDADKTEAEDLLYHPLHITLVSSKTKPLPSKLGGSASVVSQILPIPPIGKFPFLDGVHEITYLRDVYHPFPSSVNSTSLYRILSSKPVSLKVINMFFDAVEELHTEKIEHAYPVLYPRSDGFSSFKLNEGLWWTGAIEAVGSEVDATWVAGENVGDMIGRDIVGGLKG